MDKAHTPDTGDAHAVFRADDSVDLPVMSISPLADTRASTRWRPPVIVLVALALVTWLVLPRLFKANALGSLLTLRWPWLCAAVVAQIGMQWGRGLLLHGVASTRDARLSRTRATLVVLGASGVGLLGGGFPGYAAALYRWTRASHVPATSAAMAAWIPSLLLSAAVAFIALSCSALMLTSGVLSGREWISVGVALVVAIAVLVAVALTMRDAPRRARYAIAVSRFWSRLRRRAYDDATARVLVERIDDVLAMIRSRSWWWLSFVAIFTAACDGASVWALLVAARAPLTLVAAGAAWGVPQLLGNASMLPGGAGVVEVTMTPLLTRLGVAAAPALAVVLSYRALSFWVPMIAGLPLILWFERRA